MALGRPTNSTNSTGAAGLDGSMSAENDVEDEVRRETGEGSYFILFSNVAGIYANLALLGVAEDQLDRMTLWIRNVESEFSTNTSERYVKLTLTV